MQTFNLQENLKDYLDFQYVCTKAELNDVKNSIVQRKFLEVGSWIFTPYNTYYMSILAVCQQCEWTELLNDEQTALSDEAQQYIDTYFMCFKESGFVVCRSVGGDTIHRYIRCHTIDNIIKDL